MEWATNNLAESLLVLGILLLVIEVAVLGFSTFVLFFVGCAAVITSILLYLGIVPDTLSTALLTLGVVTAVSAVLLWKPLKNMQTQVDTTKAKGDLVGHTFMLKEEVSPELNPLYRYSGIDWTLSSATPLAVGTQVEVIEADVGKFIVQAKA